MSLSKNEKEAQLNGLTNLVTGIRLFNKFLKKGGDSIEDSKITINFSSRTLQYAT